MQKYQEIERIGKGSFGVVKKIRRKSDGKVMVWKEIYYKEMTSIQRQQLISEVNILKQLKHEHIIEYYDRIVQKNDSIVYILMEYCPGGDLSGYIKKAINQKTYIDQEIIWKVFFQLMEALNYCHTRQRKTLHRDLKPANIFIGQTGKNIKLGDFGLSKQLGQYSEYAKTFVGTPYYMSPQQIENVQYNQKCDIWSVGCIIYQMASLKRPFSGKNHIQLGVAIKKGKFSRIPKRYSQDLQNIINKMLKLNPKMRPSASDFLTHPLNVLRKQQTQIFESYEKLKKREDYLIEKQKEYAERLEMLRELKKEKEKKNKNQLQISVEI